jgi:para-aminobenzoate synthetase component 1
MTVNDLLKSFDDEEAIIWLDSHGYKDKYSRIERLLAIGVHRSHIIESGDVMPLEKLDNFISKAKLPVFFLLSYDLKNAIEKLHTQNNGPLNCPLIIAIEPKKLSYAENGVMFYQSQDANDTLELHQNTHLNNFDYHSEKIENVPNDTFKPTDKSHYLKQFKAIKQHIQRGDIYEMNYCMSFKASNVKIDPIATFCQLSHRSPAPFSAYFKFREWHLMSSSPERYIRKDGQEIISQPIKGTTSRFKDLDKDKASKEYLSASEKEKNENVMIVDLVRNDLSKIALKDSVKVAELFGVYSFAQVHQMISTVEAKVKDNISFGDTLKATFPMGSMTGAPKISAMKIADEKEDFARGFYAGAIGYHFPNGNFDSSVIIRSLIYNKKNNCAYMGAGSAVTDLAEAESEYEECLLKAHAILTSISYESEPIAKHI